MLNFGRADAGLACDGTHLPKNAKDLAEKSYNTYFVVRGDNAWADKHTDELQSVLLTTDYTLATKERRSAAASIGMTNKSLRLCVSGWQKATVLSA